MSVSVLIATYNRAHYLRQALDSILQQTRLPEEIIVINDGSTDNTVEAVAHYGSRIHCISTENHGKAAALNSAIHVAKGSHILIFDDDDVALPDALQSHIEFLSAHPEIDFSYSSNYVYCGDGNIWQRNKWKLKVIPAYPADEFFIRHAMIMHTLLQGMLIPKRCFEIVGDFDTTLLRSEDSEMLLRLAHRFIAYNLQKPTFVLRLHSGLRGPAHERHVAAQQMAIFLKYGQRIYRKMREDYPLSAYLPHTPGGETVIADHHDQGRALLQRSGIMLQHGLVEEAIADMKDGLQHLKHSEYRASWIIDMLTEAFDVDSWRLTHPFRLISESRKILEILHATLLVQAIARGVYWALLRSLRQYRWRDALRSAVMLALCFSPYDRHDIAKHTKHP